MLQVLVIPLFQHLQRVWRLCAEVESLTNDSPHGGDAEAKALRRAMHVAINDVTQGIEGFAFNKSVAALYQYTNAIAKSDAPKSTKTEAMQIMAKLMQPMTPHLAEEVWQVMGGVGLVAKAEWPKFDATMLEDDMITLPIQVNGKRRSEITVAKDLAKDEVEKLALADEAVIKALAGGQPKKLIVVPGRIVNVVI